MTQQTPSDNSIPLTPVLVFFGGITLILVALFANRPAVVSTTAPTVTPVVIVQAAANPASQQVASAGLDPQKVKAGESIFQSICFACHGFNAKGIPGLGKTLIGSQFFNSQTDDQLLAFLQVGRPVTDPLNTTGVAMPAKGGNPSLKDEDLLNVIAYIRSLNANQVAAAPTASVPTATLPPAEFQAGAISALLGTSPTSAPVEATSAVEPTSAPTEVAAVPEPTAAPSSNFSVTGPGAVDYVRACAGCHGMKGEGQPMLTKPLSESEMLKSTNTMGIMNMFTVPHPPSAEFQHPYRGGYPELTDNQLLGIISYLIALPK